MRSLELFLSSIRSEQTRDKYYLYFKKYQEFIGFDDIFCQNNPKLIELKIVEFINEMKSNGKGYSTIHNYVSSILAFYKINDIVLNIVKINKFIPIARKVRNDRSYTREEISKLLEISDERFRVVILLMASSGIRVGALPLLRLRHLQGKKLIVYENEPEQYFTFITPECQMAVDNYIDMRKRYGENIDDNSLLIREQFDLRDPFQISKPKAVTTEGIKWKIVNLATKSGVRSKDVMSSHGFRKFFTTQLINAKVNPEIREMLLGHKIGLASCYYRPTEEEMYAEYEKADLLTINEENRLKRRVQILEMDASRMDRIERQLERVESLMKKGKTY